MSEPGQPVEPDTPAGSDAGCGESTPDYPPGTDGYLEPTEGAAPRNPAAPEAAGDTETAEGEARPKEGFWTRLGFASFEDYMAYMRRQQARQIKPKGARVPAARVPGEEVGDIRRPPRSPPPRTRQVNVKLREQEGADLDRAARSYGVAAATLARMLVNRGVAAILDGD